MHKESVQDNGRALFIVFITTILFGSFYLKASTIYKVISFHWPCCGRHVAVNRLWCVCSLSWENFKSEFFYFWMVFIFLLLFGSSWSLLAVLPDWYLCSTFLFDHSKWFLTTRGMQWGKLGVRYLDQLEELEINPLTFWPTASSCVDASLWLCNVCLSHWSP